MVVECAFIGGGGGGGGGTLSVADKVAPTLIACIQLHSIFVLSTWSKCCHSVNIYKPVSDSYVNVILPCNVGGGGGGGGG